MHKGWLIFLSRSGVKGEPERNFSAVLFFTGETASFTEWRQYIK
jgi:hypothetical protein